MPEAIHIGLPAMLRAMAAIAWSAFRHPFSTSVIDLVTGKCIERFPAYEIPRERETLMISRSINAEGWTAEELLADVASKFEHLESQVEQLKEIKVILAKTEEALRK